MGESADNSNESDESIEVQERADEFGIGQGIDQSIGFSDNQTQQDYVNSQNQLASQNVASGITPMSVQDFAREQSFFDQNPMSNVVDAPFTSRVADINVGAGDIFGLNQSIQNQLSKGGTPVFNRDGTIGGVIGSMRDAPVFGMLPAFMQNLLPDTQVYTGRSELDPFGFTPDDDNNNEIVQPITNQITGQTRCPDGYVFDEDLQACRLDTGTNKLSNTPINVSGTNVPTSGFFRGSLLDNAPMNTPSGFNFADANQKFVNQFVYDPSIYKNPMGLSGFTPFRRS